MDAITARRTLAQGRLAFGLATLVAPNLAARVLGIDSSDRATAMAAAGTWLGTVGAKSELRPG